MYKSTSAISLLPLNNLYMQNANIAFQDTVALYTDKQIHRYTETFSLEPEKLWTKCSGVECSFSPSKLTAGETQLSGFDWDRVNFLQSSQYGSVFWLCG